jgi:hypothetical protein
MSRIKSSRSKQLAMLHMTFQTIGHIKIKRQRPSWPRHGPTNGSGHPIYACYTAIA